MRAQEIMDAAIARKDSNGAVAILILTIIKNAADTIDAETPSKRLGLYKAIEDAVFMLLDFLPKEVSAQVRTICKARMQDLGFSNE